jgi:hypothetical protein
VSESEATGLLRGTQWGGVRAMVANVLTEGVKFIALFAAVLAVMFLFPFLMMVFFRRFFLGNPDKKLDTIRRVKN